MRVLHVVTVVDDDGSAGGALAVAVNQCIELRRRGQDARIAGGWGGSGPAPTQLEGVPVHLFRARRMVPGLGGSGLFSPALLRWVRSRAAGFDVVHLHLARDLILLAVAGRLQRLAVPYVVQTHGALNPRPGGAGGAPDRLVDRWMTRRALLSARHVFAASLEERDGIARVSGSPGNISLLPGGVVLPDRVPVTDHDGPSDVLFLGRLQPNRRVMAFAAAAERLVRDGLDATFTVIGPDGGDLRELRRFLAAHPHLADRLRYDGALPHHLAVARLRRADLYVLPSVDGQAYPVSLLEAMAAGVPSICTTECSLAGVLAREHAAIVANPTDDALYGAMRRILTDRGARARLAAAAVTTAASEFSMAPVAEVLEEEYLGAVARAGAHAVARAGVPGVPGGGRRRHLLWVLSAPTSAHVEVWDALRAGAHLTVVLTDGARDAGAVPTGAAGDGPSDQVLRTAALSGRGYPVRALARGRQGRGVVRALVEERPDAVVVDGVDPRTLAVLTRRARRTGVPVVVAVAGDGPGAAARAALVAAGIDATRPAARIDLDLRHRDPWPDGRRGTPGPDPAGSGATEWGTTGPGTAGPRPGPTLDDVIDLQQRTRSAGRRRR